MGVLHSHFIGLERLPVLFPSASVAGDRQVRIVDAEIASSTSEPEMNSPIRSDSVRVLRCHRGRVKRLVTEESPDIFLTVAEVGHEAAPIWSILTTLIKDGTVRQHDLRMHHVCREDSCPTPLVKLKHELSTISSSPLTPYQFVIAGDSPYVCCFHWL